MFLNALVYLKITFIKRMKIFLFLFYRSGTKCSLWVRNQTSINAFFPSAIYFPQPSNPYSNWKLQFTQEINSIKKHKVQIHKTENKDFMLKENVTQGCTNPQNVQTLNLTQFACHQDQFQYSMCMRKVLGLYVKMWDLRICFMDVPV